MSSTLEGSLRAIVGDDGVASAEDRRFHRDATEAEGLTGVPSAVVLPASTDEVATVVCMLTGEPRQGRIGVGWSTLSTVRDEAVLRSVSGASAVTVAELDDALDRIATTTGSGSAAVRQEILAEVRRCAETHWAHPRTVRP